MDLAHSPPRHLVITSARDIQGTRALIAEFDRRFRPRDLLLVAHDDVQQRRLTKLVPFVEALAPRGTQATAFVCLNYACQLPVTDPAAFAAGLEGKAH